jgi:NAD(P)H-nitrite reductase large subunit
MQDEIICYCSKVTRQQILEAIKGGAKTLQDIQEKTNACTIGDCKELNPKKRCCSGDIVKILNEQAGNV